MSIAKNFFMIYLKKLCQRYKRKRVQILEKLFANDFVGKRSNFSEDIIINESLILF